MLFKKSNNQKLIITEIESLRMRIFILSVGELTQDLSLAWQW